jgi:hypothetical protein
VPRTLPVCPLFSSGHRQGNSVPTPSAQTTAQSTPQAIWVHSSVAQAPAQSVHLVKHACDVESTPVDRQPLSAGNWPHLSTNDIFPIPLQDRCAHKKGAMLAGASAGIAVCGAAVKCVTKDAYTALATNQTRSCTASKNCVCVYGIHRRIHIVDIDTSRHLGSKHLGCDVSTFYTRCLQTGIWFVIVHKKEQEDCSNC